MQKADNERTVTIGDLEPKAAKQTLYKSVSHDMCIGEDAIPKFTPVSYYAFRAEWAVVGNDIQVKFFLPAHAQLDTPEKRQLWMDYWLKRFTEKLDQVARRYFEADYPRLVVKWTEEFMSWWFRASAFGYLLDPATFLQGFFEQLDASLPRREARG